MFDTIAAISTPVGKGGIGVIKISGENAVSIASRIFQPSGQNFKSHRVYHGKIFDTCTNEMLDEILLIYMKAPKSYTGEDTVELQCHGGPYVLRKILSLCLMLGARPAEKGEFTRRAFINGKLDLTQAEAITDLIESKISTSLNLACKQLEGNLSLPIKEMRQNLIEFLAKIEVCIDFPEDVEEISKTEIKTNIENILNKIKELLKTAEAGRIYREGVTISIIGRPNVGKSSLLNKLIHYERAIVTDIPGTTRDTLEEYINLNNIPVKLIDTAGVRDTDNLIEQMGLERTYLSIKESDIVLVVIEADKGLVDEELKLIENLGEKKFIIVANKIDLVKEPKTIFIPAHLLYVPISAKFGQHITELENKITEIILSSIDMTDTVPINTRHQQLLYKAREALNRAYETIEKKLPIDFISIDIKDSIIALGEIIGDEVTEQVIDNIFENFCVGK